MLVQVHLVQTECRVVVMEQYLASADAVTAEHSALATYYLERIDLPAHQVRPCAPLPLPLE